MARSARDRRGISTTAELGRYAGLGLSFAATMALFGAAGWWLDRRLSTSPWLFILGLFLGAGLAFYSLLRAVPRSGSAGPARSATKPPPRDR